MFSFTHTLEKRNDGRCQFLTDDNRCNLHIEHGADAKPAMCSLFPYTFTVTPDSVLASLSFASSGVLFNSGKLLSEQEDLLTQQLERLKSLFNPDPSRWNKLQILDGFPISWAEFSAADSEYLKVIEEDSESSGKNSPPRNLQKKLKKIESSIVSRLPQPSIAERDPKLESRPKIIDQILLKHLEALYFPEDVFSNSSYDLKARDLMLELVAAPNTVGFGKGKNATYFSEMIKVKLGKLPDEVEELLDRFLYMRYFSKLFFGPGFHHLSLLAGVHHLNLLAVLLRLKFKQYILAHPTSTIDLALAVEIVRVLERRLTQLDLSRESVSVLEVLLASPERAQRINFIGE